MKLVAAYRVLNTHPNIPLPLYKNDTDERYFIQVINQNNKVTDFELFETYYNDRIFSFESNEVSIFTNIGDNAIYIVENKLKDFSIFTAIEIREQFSEIKKKYNANKKPFFLLSLARLSKSQKHIRNLYSYCFELLNQRTPSLALSWVDSLGDEKRFVATEADEEKLNNIVFRISILHSIIEAIDAACLIKFSSRSELFRNLFNNMPLDEYEVLITQFASESNESLIKYNYKPFMPEDFSYSLESAIPDRSNFDLSSSEFDDRVEILLRYFHYAEARASVRTDRNTSRHVNEIIRKTKNTFTLRSKEKAAGIAFLIILREKQPDIYKDSLEYFKRSAHAHTEMRMMSQKSLFDLQQTSE